MDLEKQFQNHTHNGIDSKKVSIRLRDTEFIKGAAVTAPSGGATVDSEARAAINTLITRLEALGLIEEN